MLAGVGNACAIGASAILAGEAMALVSAPGCGDGGGCDQAARSVFGRVPGLDWPTSFVGLAWFAMLAAGWLATVLRHGSSGMPAWLRWAARGGAAMSVFFIGVMVAGGYLCPYCLAAHLGSFAFLLAIECSPRAAHGSHPRSLSWAVASAVVLTASLGIAQRFAHGKAEQRLAESAHQAAQAAPQDGTTGSGSGGGGGGFTGRWRQGPEAAPIRVVIISDYQCPECREAEAEARKLLEERDDVSLSAKHFPMCTDCNRYASRTLHANACWAARVAETAGALRGNDGFWQMHRWLFERSGGFTNAELEAGLIELGYEPKQFLALMQTQDVVQGISADIDEASSLGLYTTPMIFLNGVELRGWRPRQGSLARAVRLLAEERPPAATAAGDRPPPAVEKIIADYAAKPQVVVPADTWSWPSGPTGAPLRIVIWGDYQEPHTAAADRCARAIAAQRGDVQYTFRHYPVDQSCNPVAPRTMHPQACLASRAAEAAGSIGGADACWKMHAWLMEHQGGVTPQSLRDAAPGLGLDAAALLAAMNDPTVATIIQEDARAAWSYKDMLSGNFSIPLIFVNERHTARWRTGPGGECLLGRIVDEAHRSASR